MSFKKFEKNEKLKVDFNGKNYIAKVIDYNRKSGLLVEYSCDRARERICIADISIRVQKEQIGNGKENKNSRNIRKQKSKQKSSKAVEKTISSNAERLIPTAQVHKLNEEEQIAFMKTKQWNDLGEYEKKRQKQIWTNNQFLLALNITKEKKNLSEACGTKKKTKPLVPRKQKKNLREANVPARRSKRMSGAPVEYTKELIDSFGIEPSSNKRSFPKSKSGRKGKRRKVEVLPLSAEQEERLRNETEWLEEFESFLLRDTDLHKQCSRDNCRSVMKQTRKLVAGAGISYHHWSPGVLFLENQPVNLSSNFLEFHVKAQNFEDLHGRDRGNGWLLRHPLKKLWLFQQHKLRQS
eukprot:g4866.t1